MRTVFYNGKIFTANPQSMEVDSMIIEDGIIKEVGEYKNLISSINDSDNKVDLEGKRIIPAFVESHTHPIYLAENMKMIAVLPPQIYSIEELLESIKNRIKDDTSPYWIQGWGYDEGKLKEHRAPNRLDLDKASTTRPIVITRTCTHIISVNSKALELANIDRHTPDPEGGIIERDSEGNPTGVLIEQAKELVVKCMPMKNIEEMSAEMKDLSQDLLSKGITTVSEMLGRKAPMDYYATYKAAQKAGWVQRTAIYYHWDSWKDNPPALDADMLDRQNDVFIVGVKLIGDGSVSGTSAWVSEGYISDKDNHGMPVASMEDYETAYDYAVDNQLQLSIHAMGDLTIKRVAEFSEAKKPWLKDMPSIRVEHCSIPTMLDLDMFKKNNVWINTQPIFSYAEIESYLENLGLERTKKYYPCKKMLDNSNHLVLSSDAPATAWADPVNPFIGLKAVTTRICYEGTELGTDECISIRDAVSLYTREAAKIMGFQNIGCLKAGYEADFIILSDDIFEIANEEIDKLLVLKTYMRGHLVYRR